MHVLNHLLENNRAWADSVIEKDPGFFSRLAAQQRPQYLWIGCSDSRVPANQIVGMMPGEVFVHRNVANVVAHTDFNCLSVIQYAVEVLQVRHIIVCGHYGCGGVAAALENRQLGLIDNWLRHIKDVYAAYRERLEALPDDARRLDLLCELNVIQQVRHTCQTPIVQNAWSAGRPLWVHGWIYGIHNGLIKDLGVCIERPEQLAEMCPLSTQ